MLNNQEFEDWCRCLKIPEVGQKVIKQIRSSEPVRRVRSSRNNVSGDYCSRKMGKTLQFESHKVELPGIEEYEQDTNVLEYYDQPYRFTLKFAASSGRTITVAHVPDFFVLRIDCAGFEEWKPEVKWEQLAQKSPNRYQRTADGHWHSPPAADAVEQLGLYYRMRSDTEIDWLKYRNRQFLKAYSESKYQVSSQVAQGLLTLVSSHPGITYAELLQEQKANSDDLNALIAGEVIYVDLSAAPLAEPERVHLFENQQIAKAYALLVESKTLTVTEAALSIDNIDLSEQLTISDRAIERFLRASPEALAEANYRYQVIQPYLTGNKRENEPISERTIRDWKAKFRVAKQNYNCGYIGLIDNQIAKGNRSERIAESAEKFIEKIIEEQYETLKQKGRLSVYGVLAKEWEKAGRTDNLPSYATFCSRIRQRSGYQQTKKRQGQRAAYQQSVFYWELELTTPRHGDRPFEIAHIDHTQIDIELVCSRTGRPLGRPWATVLIDAYSRRILAVYLTFDEPSYRSCMMVLRICVQRFSRFPETIVVDGGAEFGSTYFETLLAAFECNKKQRPTALARFGSIIERLFGTTNTEFFYNLKGNTQITKNVRLVTKSNNPVNQAVWTLDELYERFCAYSYEFYDSREHPALGQSPQQAFTYGLAQSGTRPHQQIVYDQNFKIFTWPSTPKGTAKVQPSRGVKINYLYYWSIDDSFLRPEVEGTDVPVRYDPFDMGTAYAYVKGQWVRCISEYYKSFHNRSEREVKLASTQLRRSRQKHAQRIPLTAKEKATYLEGAEAQEFLLLQRLHDLARGDVRSLIEGEPNSESSRSSLASCDNHVVGAEPEGVSQKLCLGNEINFNNIESYKDEELW